MSKTLKRVNAPKRDKNRIRIKPDLVKELRRASRDVIGRPVGGRGAHQAARQLLTNEYTDAELQDELDYWDGE